MLTFLENFSALTWQMVVMWIIGGVLILVAQLWFRWRMLKP